MRKFSIIALACLSLLIIFSSGVLRVSALAALSAQATAPSLTSDIVAQSSSSQSVTQAVVKRARSSWPWYITRGSGIVAAIMLGILILLGVGQITGYTFTFLEPITAWATHRAIGLAFGVAVLIHIFSLLFDKFVPFTIAQVLIPFAAKYKPVTIWGVHFGTLYVALGVLAFYCIAAIILTSLVWIEKKPYTWKLIHLLSYLVVIFIFIHALYLGTDLAHGILRWLWILGAVIMAAAAGYRLWRAQTI